MSGTDNAVLSPICPSCKTTNQPRFKAMTLAMTCHSCGTYFNLGRWTSESVEFIYKSVPDLAIGSRGKINDVVYEITGYVVKEDNRYHFKWREYSLYNPKFGLAFLSENNGHWNFLVPARAPVTRVFGTEFTYENTRFQLYARMKATVIFGQGEFFTDVFDATRKSRTDEYLSVPALYVCDVESKSVHWFKGAYLPSDILSDAFKVPKDKLPKKEGVILIQVLAGASP